MVIASMLSFFKFSNYSLVKEQAENSTIQYQGIYLKYIYFVATITIIISIKWKSQPLLDPLSKVIMQSFVPTVISTVAFRDGPIARSTSSLMKTWGLTFARLSSR